MKSIKRPTRHDVFTAIWQYYQYPNYTLDGSTDWLCSQDIQNQETLRNLEQQEAFVKQVSQSNEMAFIFGETPSGCHLKKTNPLGQLFYELLIPATVTVHRPYGQKHYLKFPMSSETHLTPRLTQLPDWCQYVKSEYLKHVDRIVCDLRLGKAEFTGNPMHEIAKGLNEGQLINSFIIRVREACKSPDFKSSLTRRKKASEEAFRQTEDYIKGLQTKMPALYAIPLVLGYPYANNQEAVTLEASTHHLQQFLENCQADPNLQAPVGWWWKRECLTELGYRYALFFFFDGSITHYSSLQILKEYRQYWHTVTQNNAMSL